MGRHMLHTSFLSFSPSALFWPLFNCLWYFFNPDIQKAFRGKSPREILCRRSAYCCSITGWNFWSIFPAHSSQIIRHSAEQRGKGDKFLLLFGVRKYLVTLSSAYHLHQKRFFSTLTLLREKKALQSSCLFLFCMTSKHFCNSQTFCVVRMLFSAHLFSEVL